MYGSDADPYCYPGSSILKNLAGLTSRNALDRFEAVATARRFLEPMPAGRWSVRHYCAIHRHIFQDVYAWAGRLRTIRISKDDSMFCYPEHIGSELRHLFGNLAADRCFARLDVETFASKIAHFLAELNAIHAFRDGNGRTQLAFISLLAAHVGHPFDFERLEPNAMLNAMIASFLGREALLADEIKKLVM